VQRQLRDDVRRVRDDVRSSDGVLRQTELGLVQGADAPLQLRSARQRGTTPQRPAEHGRPLQQSLESWQICPKRAQVLPASFAGGGGGGLPASLGGGVLASFRGGVPASGPPQGPHTPAADPGGSKHAVPGQQSAFVVQAPQAAMHCWPEQT
jgi:hypothetical protein